MNAVLDEGWRTGDIANDETPADKIVCTQAMGDLVVAHLGCAGGFSMALQAPGGTSSTCFLSRRVCRIISSVCASAVFSRYRLLGRSRRPSSSRNRSFSCAASARQPDVVSKEMFATITGEDLQDPAWRRSCEERSPFQPASRRNGFGGACRRAA